MVLKDIHAHCFSSHYISDEKIAKQMDVLFLYNFDI